MATKYQLQGKAALVTGAGIRLGRAFALGLAEAGADVVVHYNRSAEPAEATARAVQEMGRHALTIRADLGQRSQSQALLEQAEALAGPISLLVNSAAIFGQEGPRQTTSQIWDEHLEINLTAPFVLSQALADLREQDEASIVNIVDWRALRPGVDHFAYTIAKAGLVAATLSLAQAYAPRIRVNGLALGAILPPSGQETGDEPIRGVPLSRWGDAEDAVEALLFLLSGPKYITGEILHVDGGRHLT
jgi:pteridine reductase